MSRASRRLLLDQADPVGCATLSSSATTHRTSTVSVRSLLISLLTPSLAKTGFRFPLFAALETQVGIQSVLQCHGSFATATCVLCKYHVKGSFIEREIMQQKVPMCPRCAEADELAETARAKKRKTQAGGAKGKGKGKSKSGWGGGSSDEEEGGGTSSGGSLGSLGRGVMKVCTGPLVRGTRPD